MLGMCRGQPPKKEAPGDSPLAPATPHLTAPHMTAPHMTAPPTHPEHMLHPCQQLLQLGRREAGD